MPDVQKKTTSQKRVATHKADTKIFDPAKQVLWSRPGYLVRRLNQIHYAMFYEECKTQNVTPVQYGVLTALSLSPWLDQTAIGMELGLDRTTTADVVKRLQERGLVERRINPNDKRSRQASSPRKACASWASCRRAWPAPSSACWSRCPRATRKSS